MCIQEYSESFISVYWTFIELHSTKHLILQICHMSGTLLRFPQTEYVNAENLSETIRPRLYFTQLSTVI